jgi:hypothetical protein
VTAHSFQQSARQVALADTTTLLLLLLLLLLLHCCCCCCSQFINVQFLRPLRKEPWMAVPQRCASRTTTTTLAIELLQPGQA